MISKIWTIATVATVLVSAVYAGEISNDELKAKIQGLTDDEITIYRAAFALYDHDNNGSLSEDEISKTLNTITSNTATSAQVAAMMAGDKDRSKSIDLVEFISMVHHKTASSNLDLLFYKVYQGMDKNHDGTVSAGEYLNWLRGKGWKSFDHAKVTSLIAEVDHNNDGELNHVEMLRTLKNIIKEPKN